MVVVKLSIYLPVDFADVLYGLALLVTLVISTGELLGVSYFVIESSNLDFVLGFLFPMDCYAILVLFGLPLTN